MHKKGVKVKAIVLGLLFFCVGCNLQPKSNNKAVSKKENEAATHDNQQSNVNEDLISMALPSITEVAQNNSNFSILTQALQVAELSSTLTAAGNYTVFAPTDEAFLDLPSEVLSELLANPEQLKKILLYHVLADKVSSSEVVNLSNAKSLEGSRLKILSTGSSVVINSSNIINVDIEANNGIIHVIDKVLTPPGNIIETLRMEGNFSTLLVAIEAAGLTEVFKQLGPVTFFAPDDQAFAQIPQATLQGLLNNPVQLGQILRFHVISQEILAQDLNGSKSTYESLLENRSLLFQFGSGVQIQGNDIIEMDIYSSNGVIHRLNGVLLP